MGSSRSQPKQSMVKRVFFSLLCRESFLSVCFIFRSFLLVEYALQERLSPQQIKHICGQGWGARVSAIQSVLHGFGVGIERCRDESSKPFTYVRCGISELSRCNLPQFFLQGAYTDSGEAYWRVFGFGAGQKSFALCDWPLMCFLNVVCLLRCTLHHSLRIQPRGIFSSTMRSDRQQPLFSEAAAQLLCFRFSFTAHA